MPHETPESRQPAAQPPASQPRLGATEGRSLRARRADIRTQAPVRAAATEGPSLQGVEPLVRIAVCGAGTESAELNALAERVGAEIAASGAALVCGGLAGVMEAAARGAARAGGLTIGVLPGRDAGAANPWITLPLPTAMGEGRNVLVVRFADAVIAIGGEWGTLSEIALARKIGVPVVLLAPTYTHLGLDEAKSPQEAVRLAFVAAARAGTP